MSLKVDIMEFGDAQRAIHNANNSKKKKDIKNNLKVNSSRRNDPQKKPGGLTLKSNVKHSSAGGNAKCCNDEECILLLSCLEPLSVCGWPQFKKDLLWELCKTFYGGENTPSIIWLNVVNKLMQYGVFVEKGNYLQFDSSTINKIQFRLNISGWNNFHIYFAKQIAQINEGFKTEHISFYARVFLQNESCIRALFHKLQKREFFDHDTNLVIAKTLGGRLGELCSSMMNIKDSLQVTAGMVELCAKVCVVASPLKLIYQLEAKVTQKLEYCGSVPTVELVAALVDHSWMFRLNAKLSISLNILEYALVLVKRVPKDTLSFRLKQNASSAQPSQESGATTDTTTADSAGSIGVHNDTNATSNINAILLSDEENKTDINMVERELEHLDVSVVQMNVMFHWAQSLREQLDGVLAQHSQAIASMKSSNSADLQLQQQQQIAFELELKARSVFEEILTMIRNTPRYGSGIDHNVLYLQTKVQISLAALFLLTKNSTHAELMIEKSTSELNELFREREHPLVAQCMICIAQLEQLQNNESNQNNDLTSIKQLYSTALSILYACYSGNYITAEVMDLKKSQCCNFSIAKCLFNLGDLEEQNANLTDALEHYMAAYKCILHVYGEKSILLPDVLYVIGNIYVANKKYLDALVYIQQANMILEKKVSKDLIAFQSIHSSDELFSTEYDHIIKVGKKRCDEIRALMSDSDLKMAELILGELQKEDEGKEGDDHEHWILPDDKEEVLLVNDLGEEGLHSAMDDSKDPKDMLSSQETSQRDVSPSPSPTSPIRNSTATATATVPITGVDPRISTESNPKHFDVKILDLYKSNLALEGKIPWVQSVCGYIALADFYILTHNFSNAKDALQDALRICQEQDMVEKEVFRKKRVLLIDDGTMRPDDAQSDSDEEKEGDDLGEKDNVGKEDGESVLIATTASTYIAQLKCQLADVECEMNDENHMVLTPENMEYILSLYKDSLSLYKHVFGEEDTLVADTLIRIGLLFYASDDHSNSQETLEEAETLLSLNYDQGVSKSMAELKYYLSRTFHAMAYDDDAKKLVYECLSILLKNLKIPDPGLLSLESAFDVNIISLDISQITENIKKNQTHTLIADAIGNIGSLYHLQDKYPEAEKFYQIALLMFEVIYKDEPNVFAARLYNNMASMYDDHSNMTDAEVYYKKALEHLFGLFEEGHPQIIHTLSNYSLLLLGNQRYAEALPLLNIVHASYIENYGDEHELTVHAKESIILAEQSISGDNGSYCLIQ